MIHFIRSWLLKRELERNLRARKRLRPYRQASARKGVETRHRKARA